MLFFYDSLVENANFQITVVFGICFSFFLLPPCLVVKSSCFEIVFTKKVYFLLKKKAALKK